jgi:hypothetical protein
MTISCNWIIVFFSLSISPTIFLWRISLGRNPTVVRYLAPEKSKLPYRRYFRPSHAQHDPSLWVTENPIFFVTDSLENLSKKVPIPASDRHR